MLVLKHYLNKIFFNDSSNIFYVFIYRNTDKSKARKVTFLCILKGEVSKQMQPPFFFIYLE